MSIDARHQFYEGDKPLTRADVERLRQGVENSDKLNLIRQNLQGIDLAHFYLDRANLSGANLSGANLSGAALRNADLSGATLSGANLRNADLSGATLSGANLSRANLSGADLGEATLRNADLSGATLFGTGLRKANLREANLLGANLREADLREADLSGANLKEADLRGTIGWEGSEDAIARDILAFPIRVTEEPLTARNLIVIVSTLTELHTKALLIQQGRFSDLIDYTQTHDARFTREASLIIGKLSHNSPALVELLLNPATLAAGAGAVATLAGALKIAIDNVGQTRLRYKEKELENQRKELEIKIKQQEAQQRSDIEKQQVRFELEKQQLELEKQQLELEKQRLDIEKSRVEIALETAGKMVDTLRPGVDIEIRGILIQALLPNLLQLGHTQGLELPLLASQEQSGPRSSKALEESGRTMENLERLGLPLTPERDTREYKGPPKYIDLPEYKRPESDIQKKPRLERDI